MKPNEKKPETVFRIISRATGEAQGSGGKRIITKLKCRDFRS